MINSVPLINQCFAELERMGRAIQRRQWQEALEISLDYSDQIQCLVNALDSNVAVSELERLSLLHRRQMRQLSNQMDAIKEDIASLESGSKRLRMSRQLLQ